MAAIKKTSSLPSKAYKSILSKAYVMILIILSSIAVGFYIININDILQKIYQVDGTTTGSNTAVAPINETVTNSLKSVYTSDKSTIVELPTNTRTNPFK